MRSYYADSIEELRKLSKNKKMTKEEWNSYKTGKPLFGADSIMWIYANTNDWNTFMQIFERKELKNEQI